MTNWKKLIGKRCLVRKTYSRLGVIEVTVVQVSPSGERVKFRFQSGTELWCNADEYQLDEVLGFGCMASVKRWLPSW